jgi:hypothetical protein
VDLADIERHYLYAAWITHGEAIRQAPVRPATFMTDLSAKRRELYRVMVEVTRDGSWKRDGVDALTKACERAGLTMPYIDLVIAFGEVDPAHPLDVETCAAEIETAYARSKVKARLLEELQAVDAGAFDQEAAE